MTVLSAENRACDARMNTMATERGFDRLVNFSDAVVAIAATILILPIVDQATEASRGGVDATITAIFPQLLIFALSFVVIVRFWFSHHRFFERLVGYSPVLVWFNLMWLVGIVVMPFPTQLVATASNSDTLAVTVYIGNMLWIAVSQLLMGIVVYRDPKLLAPDELRVVPVIVAATIAGLFSVAFVIGLIWPAIALWSLLLLGATRLITMPLIRRFTGSTAAAQGEAL